LLPDCALSGATRLWFLVRAPPGARIRGDAELALY